MPREIFGDVTTPSIKIGNRKWYTVPVSLGTHAAIVLAMIAIPMLAPGLLPMPDSTTVFTTTELPPAPPPPRPVTPVDAKPQPAVDPDAAPTQPPNGIAPEVERLPVDPVDTIGTGTIVGVFDAAPPETPVAKAPPEPIRVGGVIRQPTKIHDSPPVYPAIAQAARVQGIVIIEAVIAEDGRVTNARVLRSVPLLDQAALDAVRTWQYAPTLLNGVPVAVIMSVVVQFKLN